MTGDVDLSIGDEWGCSDDTCELVYPLTLACFRIDAVQLPRGVGDVGESVVNGGRTHAVLLEGVGPI